MPPTTRSKRKHQQAEFEKTLLKCARDGDLEQAQELVEIHRIDVNCVDEFGYTPLMKAMRRRGQFIEIAQMLVRNGADLTASSTDGLGNTALGLLYSSFTFSDDIIGLAQLLLEKGASVDSTGPFGSLLDASIINKNGPMVSFLLDKGANTKITHVLDRIDTAVELCTSMGNADVLQRLLDHDREFDVNARKANCVSLLCTVCKHSEIEMAKLLLKRGAQVIFDVDGVTCSRPLLFAVKHKDYSLELIRLLLDNSPFSVPVNDNAVLPEMMGDGTHPLSDPLKAALLDNKTEVAQLLIDHGANVNDRPFLWEFVNDEHHQDAARWLLSARCVNVNRADRDSGETPIWAAAKHGNVELVKELLAAKADPKIRNNDGESPLGVAYRFRHTSVLYLLLRSSPAVWPGLRKLLFNSCPVDQEQAAF
jgi:ankyrin repeat protein